MCLCPPGESLWLLRMLCLQGSSKPALPLSNLLHVPPPCQGHNDDQDVAPRPEHFSPSALAFGAHREVSACGHDLQTPQIHQLPLWPQEPTLSPPCVNVVIGHTYRLSTCFCQQKTCLSSPEARPVPCTPACPPSPPQPWGTTQCHSPHQRQPGDEKDEEGLPSWKLMQW